MHPVRNWAAGLGLLALVASGTLAAPADAARPAATVKTPARADTLTPIPAPPEPPQVPVQPARRQARVAAAPVAPRIIGTGAARTLVLFDSQGDYGWLGEYYGIAASHLASHFGAVAVKPVQSYASGDAANYQAVVYLGSTYNEQLPSAFVTDVTTGTTPVVWAGFNIWQLAGTDQARAAFTERYGWDAASSYFDTVDQVAQVEYKGQLLQRDATNNTAGVLAPHVVAPEKVQVLAEGVCSSAGVETDCDPVAQTSGSRLPWALRSGNLTYVGEVPFSYMGESDRYLAFADLLYAPLEPDATPVRKAAVRLEDVSPNSDPAQLVAVADYLYEAGVPFQVATIAEFDDPAGVLSAGRPVRTTIAQKTKVLAALKYMQSRGGVLLQHGTTHQYGTLNNPYNGVSGDDFEFFAARCSATASLPAVWEPCAQDNHVLMTGPVPVDDVASHKAKILAGRKLFTRAGLGEPTIFEFPHYAGSPNAYAAAASIYPTRYERAIYFSGALKGTPDPYRWFGQFFPYSVTDVYGSKVIAENLGNYEPQSFSGHPARTSADLVANAKANLVMTESTASFFYHPYFGVDELKATVEGIKALGYTFVPATQLP